jgi:hypothetical protein
VKPSVGRVVHYVSYGTPGGEYASECRAAVITETVPIARGSAEVGVSLAVLNPAGMFFNRNVPQDEDSHAGGTWHWPEREPSEDPPQVHVSADLSPQQIKSLTAKIQAQLSQQAKRNRRPGPA